MFGNPRGVKKNPPRRLNRMNATWVMREPKLLAAPKIGAANKFAPGSGRDGPPERFYTIEEIHIRAETMTPLLKEILDYRPAPHWGINE
jgi:hypothetical protein